MAGQRIENEQMTVLLWDAVQDAGHLGCGGWSYDTFEPYIIRCNCGTVINLGRPS
jgi:hypothetical protein